VNKCFLGSTRSTEEFFESKKQKRKIKTKNILIAEANDDLSQQRLRDDLMK
jgi:hypothetical protein